LPVLKYSYKPYHWMVSQLSGMPKDVPGHPKVVVGKPESRRREMNHGTHETTVAIFINRPKINNSVMSPHILTIV